MDNSEEILQILDRYTRLKQKEFPKELDDYLRYVAKSGDTVYKWANLQYMFREKLFSVIKNFRDTTPRIDDLPQYPNVDPFNYESMKSSLIERLDLFHAAPFTVQRLCELLIDPRKQYGRIDKFMRALEKNILVSSTEPGRKRVESENGDSLDSIVNGDTSIDVNVDIETSHLLSSSGSTQNDDIFPNPKKLKLDDQDLAATKSSVTLLKPAEECKEKIEVSPSLDSKKKEQFIITTFLESDSETEKTDANINTVAGKFCDRTNDIKITEMSSTKRIKAENEMQIVFSNEENQKKLGVCIISAIETTQKSCIIQQCASVNLASKVLHPNEDMNEEHTVKEVSSIFKIENENLPAVLKPSPSLVSQETGGDDKTPLNSNFIEVENQTCDLKKKNGTEITNSLKLPASIDQSMEDNFTAVAHATEVRAVCNSNSLVQNSFNSDEQLNASVDMATDAIEIIRDETAGMDIDDNSQEAMDQ